MLAQGSIGMRPVGSVSASISALTSASATSTQHARFLAAIAPRAAADVGTAAPYLWDAVMVMQQTITAAAAQARGSIESIKL
jgi:hypothetical protein